MSDVWRLADGRSSGRVLAWQHTNGCSLRDAEDARHVADLDLLASPRRRHVTRPATPTERTLLTALSYVVPAVLATDVHSITDHVIRRRWPQLEDTADTTGGTAA